MPHGQIHPCLFWDKGVVRVPFHGVGKQFSHLGLLSSDLTALTWPENIFAICCSFLFQRELNKCLYHDTSEGSENTLMSLYNVFVMWNFSYYNTIWHFCNAGDTLQLEKIQTHALRIIFNDFESNYDALLKRADRLLLYISRLRAVALGT